MTVTSASALRNACAAHSPPKPQPRMTMRGLAMRSGGTGHGAIRRTDRAAHRTAIIARARGTFGCVCPIWPKRLYWPVRAPPEPPMADILKFRNARGEMVEVESVPATRLKNEPASIIDQVSAGKAVAITRHNMPRAVIIAYDDFRQLALAREPSLGALTAEFDRMLDAMQAPKAGKALAAAF